MGCCGSTSCLKVKMAAMIQTSCDEMLWFYFLFEGEDGHHDTDLPVMRCCGSTSCLKVKMATMIQTSCDEMLWVHFMFECEDDHHDTDFL